MRLVPRPIPAPLRGLLLVSWICAAATGCSDETTDLDIGAEDVGPGEESPEDARVADVPTMDSGAGHRDAAEGDGGGEIDMGGGGGAGCVADVALGEDFACAVRTDGRVYCWGSNESRQLGDRTSTSRPDPRPVLDRTGAELTDVAEVAAGHRYACARTRGGRVLCWGLDGSGQRGPGTSGLSGVPEPFLEAPGGAEVTDARAIAVAAAYTCIVRSGGQVTCAGLNNTGQLGDGSTGARSGPIQVLLADGGQPLASATDIDLAGFHGCALRETDVACWGRAGFGRLGIGMTDDVESRAVAPITDDAADPVIDVTAGFSYTCALRRSGALDCWGELDDFGIDGPGIGRIFRSLTPERVSSAPTGVALSRGSDGNFVCVVTPDAELHCFGQNRSGQLGDGTTTARAELRPVLDASGAAPLARVAAAVTTQTGACARLDNGALYCWGANRSGQLGRPSGPEASLPVRVDVPCP